MLQQKLKSALLLFAILLSVAMLLARVWPIAPVHALNAGLTFDQVALQFSWLYNLFAPICILADRLTILSAKQQITLWVWLFGIWLGLRIYLGCLRALNARQAAKEIGYFFCALLVLTAFYAFAILCPRPVAAFVVKSPDWMVVDFHSHTSFSWDANKRFTPEKNLSWHRAQGFDACFITDHNVFGGAAKVYEEFSNGKNFGIIPLRGEEVSLHQSHWVLIGNQSVLPNAPFDGSMDGIEKFIRAEKQNPTTAVIASLPEYWKYHWEDKEKFVDWGVDGFEIVNSFPWALDFPRSMQESILELCRAHNLVVTGISDNHGWGFATYAWNTIYIPNWRALPQQKIESAVISAIHQRGFLANQVWVRTKHEPQENVALLALDPLLQGINLLRTLTWTQTISSLIWIWLIVGILVKKYNR